MSKYDLWIDKYDNLEVLLKRKKIMQYLNGKYTVYGINKLVNLPFFDMLKIIEKCYTNDLIIKE